MKCEKCQLEGKKSTIQIGMSMTTCMGTNTYYDESGNFHYHDPNSTSTDYRCSNGHEWQESSRSKCTSCENKE